MIFKLVIFTFLLFDLTKAQLTFGHNAGLPDDEETAAAHLSSSKLDSNDKGLKKPVTSIPDDFTQPENVTFKWYYQRIEPDYIRRNFDPVQFNISLLRFENEEIVHEELLGKWISPLGSIVDPITPKNVIWHSDFNDQLTELGIPSKAEVLLKKEVQCDLVDPNLLMEMFFPGGDFQFASLPISLEFEPQVEEKLIHLRTNPMQRMSQEEKRIRSFLKSLSLEQRMRVSELPVVFFSKLGTDFEPTEKHFNLSEEEILYFIDHQELPSPSPSIFKGAFMGGVAVSSLMILAQHSYLPYESLSQASAQIGIISATAGIAVGYTANSLKNTKWIPSNLQKTSHFAASACGALVAGTCACLLNYFK